MYDKCFCQARFEAADIRVPRRLGAVQCFDDLLQKMRDARMPRVFVKLAHGSSASGVVALALGPRGSMRATTTAELSDGTGTEILYNSRCIRTYTLRREVEALVSTLIREGVHVEKWVPKASMAGKAFDLRVLMIRGREHHMVARLSNTPVTNLHLLNQRRDAALAREVVGDDAWESALDQCHRVAMCFPSALYLGVDVAFSAVRHRPVVFEANAFGDHLPGVLWNGMDTYDAELAAILA
jgi:hypothetical protein